MSKRVSKFESVNCGQGRSIPKQGGHQVTEFPDREWSDPTAKADACGTAVDDHEALISVTCAQHFQADQGTLTIVDLSCPFVNENDACSLFTMCLSLFMENQEKEAG